MVGVGEGLKTHWWPKFEDLLVVELCGYFWWLI